MVKYTELLTRYRASQTHQASLHGPAPLSISISGDLVSIALLAGTVLRVWYLCYHDPDLIICTVRNQLLLSQSVQCLHPLHRLACWGLAPHKYTVKRDLYLGEHL